MILLDDNFATAVSGIYEGNSEVLMIRALSFRQSKEGDPIYTNSFGRGGYSLHIVRYHSHSSNNDFYTNFDN